MDHVSTGNTSDRFVFTLLNAGLAAVPSIPTFGKEEISTSQESTRRSEGKAVGGMDAIAIPEGRKFSQPHSWTILSSWVLPQKQFAYPNSRVVGVVEVFTLTPDEDTLVFLTFASSKGRGI